MNRKVGAALLLCASACSTVKSYHLSPDWEADKDKLKRLVVVAAVAWQVPDRALEQPPESVRALLSLMARRYVNQKRNFLVKANVTGEPNTTSKEGIHVFAAQAVCVEGLEGVLWLDPKLRPSGGGVEADIDAQLVRCSDGAVLWEAKGGGSWASVDPLLQQTTAEYVSKFGQEVAPYVAPCFRLLKALLDTLPNVDLNDEETGEKIELGD